ncbi:MAG: AAA family ATPase [Flavobacterium sp.]|nr:AAA family ATPase [Flavobacterium sp.]
MALFRITGIELDYIGPFEKAVINFPEKQDADKAEIHIFTGENGTGKTTLLESLLAPMNEYYYNNRKQNGNSGIIVFENNGSYNVLGNYMRDFFAFQMKHQLSSSQSFFTRYKHFIDNNLTMNLEMAFFAYSGYRRLSNANIESIRELDVSPIQNAINFNNSSNAQLLIQWIANNKTKEALAFRRNDEIAAKRYEDSIKKIENAVSEITSWQIQFELEENPLAVSIIVNGTKLSFDLLPDGLKSIISWIADLLMRIDRIKWADEKDAFEKNLILFLDEIDVHLHPAWQRKILPVVQKLFKNSQIFVSTHSPFVVGSVDGAWVYKLEKRGNFTFVNEPVLSEDAKSYQTILEEIFGIKEQFGEAVEKKLDEFYLLKDKILKDEISIEDAAFQALVQKLSIQGVELESIIGMELKQINRLKGKAFA